MDLEKKATILSEKIKHLLITNFGHHLKEASCPEFYQAFCTALREEIMINWTASEHAIDSGKVRVAYFLSMEYLPGRYLGNNIANIQAQELVGRVLAKLSRNLDDVISCEPDPGLGNGGLGRLSACFLDSLATLHYPAKAYGIRYQYGIFEQEIWNGVQIEKPDCWLLYPSPWELRRDSDAVNVRYRGTPVHAKNQHGDDAYLLENPEEVRVIPFDTPIIGYTEKPEFTALTLRLWSTKESPRNFALQRYNAGLLGEAAENTSLTDVLYPNDHTEMGKRLRLKQEFLLVSASLQDIIRKHFFLHKDLSSFRDKVKIQINDTHPSLIIAELVRFLTKNCNISWKEAWETCQEVVSYTNHTILKEALEEWDERHLNTYLPRQYQVIQKLNQDFCTSIRERYPNDEEKIRRMSILENGQVRMAHLAIIGSHKVNGVAKLHAEILKQKIFPDFDALYPGKFLGITNGVTQRRWLHHTNPLLTAFLIKRIGKGWITDFSQIAKIASFASDPSSQKEFLAIKKKNKEKLLHFLARENPLRDAHGKALGHNGFLDSSALFDVQIKRFHEYKRQLMNGLHLIMLFQDPHFESRIPRLAIFGGKAAAGYARAKQIIQLLSALSRKFRNTEKTSHKLSVALIENYSVSKAEVIIPAADLSEQISTAGWEASGTGNMKLSMNGALTIGTEDGANVEMHEAVTSAFWPFRFGATSKENEKPYHPSEIYNTDAQIRQAVDALRDGLFAESPEENHAFQELHTQLKEHDPFRVLQDLRSYFETQKKVEELFKKPEAWAEMALHNIAAMGYFSTDRSIRDYAEKVWGISPLLPNKELVDQVRLDYAESDWLK